MNIFKYRTIIKIKKKAHEQTILKQFWQKQGHQLGGSAYVIFKKKRKKLNKQN